MEEPTGYVAANPEFESSDMLDVVFDVLEAVPLLVLDWDELLPAVRVHSIIKFIWRTHVFDLESEFSKVPSTAPSTIAMTATRAMAAASQMNVRLRSPQIFLLSLSLASVAAPWLGYARLSS